MTGGSYARTYTNAGDGGTNEFNPADVSDFRLDKYLVTVGRFRQFVKVALPPDGGAGWSPPAGSGKHAHLNGGAGLAAAPNVGAGQTYEPGWSTADNAAVAPTDVNLACAPPHSTWTSSPGTDLPGNPPGNQENLPINCVTWQEAYAFCIWDGGFLPSESEWEYAAAGGSQQLEYPWGSTAPLPGSQYAIYNSYYTGNPTGIAPVGLASAGGGRWGQLDLAGDVYEWILDWYASYANPCTDCAQLDAASTLRVIRGGLFNSTASDLVPWSRIVNPPTTRGLRAGFRCARSP